MCVPPFAVLDERNSALAYAISNGQGDLRILTGSDFSDLGRRQLGIMSVVDSQDMNRIADIISAAYPFEIRQGVIHLVSVQMIADESIGLFPAKGFKNEGMNVSLMPLAIQEQNDLEIPNGHFLWGQYPATIGVGRWHNSANTPHVTDFIVRERLDGQPSLNRNVKHGVVSSVVILYYANSEVSIVQ